jgi:putative N-acetylmannosamine-6-phosphate epimerase
MATVEANGKIDAHIDDEDYLPIVGIMRKAVQQGDIRIGSPKKAVIEHVCIGVALCLLVQWACSQYYRPSYSKLEDGYASRVASLVDVCGTTGKAESCEVLATHLLYRPAISTTTANAGE